MKHVVLKPFGWYPDGYTREALDVGAERDFGSAAGGLMAAGMIGEITPKREYEPAVVDRASADDTWAPVEEKPRKRRK